MKFKFKNSSQTISITTKTFAKLKEETLNTVEKSYLIWDNIYQVERRGPNHIELRGNTHKVWNQLVKLYNNNIKIVVSDRSKRSLNKLVKKLEKEEQKLNQEEFTIQQKMLEFKSEEEKAKYMKEVKTNVFKLDSTAIKLEELDPIVKCVAPRVNGNIDQETIVLARMTELIEVGYIASTLIIYRRQFKSATKKGGYEAALKELKRAVKQKEAMNFENIERKLRQAYFPKRYSPKPYKPKKPYKPRKKVKKENK